MKKKTDYQNLTNKIWLSAASAVVAIVSLVITLSQCEAAQDYTKVIMAAPFSAIPCMIQSLGFLLEKSKINYGPIRPIVGGMLVAEFILLIFNYRAMVLGLSGVYVVLAVTSMALYASRNVMFAIFYYVYMTNGEKDK